MNLKHHPAFWMGTATIIMGTMSVAYKIALDHFDPLLTAGLRAAISSLAVALITWRFTHKKVNMTITSHLLLNGILHATASVLFILGLEKSFAINYSLLGLLMPVFVYIGSIFLLHEKVHTRSLYGALVSLSGGVILVGAPLFQGDETVFNQGDLLILLGFIVVAGLVLHTKHLYKEITPHQVLAYRMAFSGIFVLILSVWQGESLDVSTVAWQGWAALLYVAIVVGALALLLLYGSLKYMNAEDTAPLFYLQTLSGVIASSLVLNERLDDVALVAGSVIVLGVLIAHPVHMHKFHFYHLEHHRDHLLKRWLDRGLKIAHLK